MKIEFEKIKESEIKNFYDGEGSIYAKMHVDELNRIMKGRLPAKSSIGLHTHSSSSEIIFVLEGKGLIICDGVEQIVGPGSVHYCKKGSSHTFINPNDEDIIIYAVVPNQ